MALDTIYDILKNRTPGFLPIAEGQYSGYSIETKFGVNTSVDTNLADVWTVGGVRTPLQAAVTLEVVSSSANDATGGSGATKVTVYGLNGSWVSTSEVVSMNGTTPVTMSTQFLRINRLRVTEVGTYAGTNAGTITCRITGGGATQANIVVDSTYGGLGTSQMTHLSIPAGVTGYILGYVVDVESNKPVRLYGVINTGVADTSSPYTQQRFPPIAFQSVSQHTDQTFSAPIVIPEKTDLVVKAYATGATTGFVSMTYQVILVEN